MHRGSCMCGNIAYEYDSEPLAKPICHCIPCRKTSGGSFSTNFIVAKDSFKVTKGTPKVFTRKGDSGHDVNYNFCPDCPTIITVEVTAEPGGLVVKYGTHDDDDEYLHKAVPQIEIYTKNKFEWLQPLAPVQKEGA